MGVNSLLESRGQRYVKAVSNVHQTCEPVWPSSKVLGWEEEGPRFESASALLSLQKLWSLDAVL